VLWAIQRDVQLACPSLWLVDKFAAAGGQAAYLYWWWVPAFSGPPPSPAKPMTLFMRTPSAHGDEVQYLWSTQQKLQENSDCGTSCPMAAVVQEKFGRFFQGEAPWEAYNTTLQNFLNMSLTSSMQNQRLSVVCDWWKNYIKIPEQLEIFMLFNGEAKFPADVDLP